MNTVCLVACTSRKGAYPAPAEFIYRSPLFAAARSYAETRCQQWFILSAKYGLLSPSDIIEPYNESLLSLNDEARRLWAEKVFSVLNARIEPKSRLIYLSGSAYRSHLDILLKEAGHETAAPLSFLGIGSQVAWLQRVAREAARLAYIDRFYGLLNRIRLARKTPSRRLSGLSPSEVNSNRGIYFFFEDGEKRMTAPFDDRVTRIGTHAVSAGSKATLWNRLRTHRGGIDGLGNHRGSIFRLHVGDSIIRQSELEPIFSTWGIGQSATQAIRALEEEIELAVSQTLGQMRVLWLEVDDEPSADSDRSFLERNLIALLAGPDGPIDLPSDRWLGRWSSRDAIRTSGMWNVNHVFEDFDPRALDVLEEYVKVAEGVMNRPMASLAPKEWRTAVRNDRSPKRQITLL